MPYRPYDLPNCSIADSLAIVGERWTLLVVRQVLLGNRRFEEIRRETGIAPNILADRLQTLVEHEVFERRIYSERPEAYEYVPTDRGRDLSGVLLALDRWGATHTTVKPSKVVVHATCNSDADPQLTCSSCGDPLHPSELRWRPGPGANGAQREDGVLPSG